ncbi:hypothetical protein LEP1GSC034_3757 [Leptospira interrogans str. 2003000735]|uniref:Uncharacterized protein n=4 Tax=Leptospira interrogans TaxID=173 RepID=A0A829D3W1_LEPIR|nr:hypothetical protein G436_1065 [Leptospira interrogans serovar Hardjo str. Norma]EJP03796.1 hypothetical protein LEP1GSC007_0469 [Leptospira interrogans serovar Bulgarica str. Mallika]EKN89111.1 hypothetical protein LEP1GSC027_4595 [Leptospira interrogans str. 2002000624]EKO96838.1 hypothetical protein LEP1GSC057_3716 [Leptospira interrogans str. Brem 329]EKQ40044.1 hypothetical protein LEP1GSC025_4536 [Leptospira interrogans str. 2002000621]EKQ47058.1 hypothetical protein LEP1GSC026_3961 [
MVNKIFPAGVEFFYILDSYLKTFKISDQKTSYFKLKQRRFYPKLKRNLVSSFTSSETI